MLANLIIASIPAAHSLLQAVTTNSGSMSDDQFSQQIALEAVRRNPVNGLVGILVPLSLFAMIAVVAWLGMRHNQSRLRIKAEFHKQLLDKFSSGREFADFLETKGSQRFLDELWSQRADTRERPLRFGIVLSMLGLALTASSWMKKDLLIPGVILLAVGAGYLISSWVSYRLARKSNPEINSSAGNLPA